MIVDQAKLCGYCGSPDFDYMSRGVPVCRLCTGTGSVHRTLDWDPIPTRAPDPRVAELEGEVERLRRGLESIWNDAYPRSGFREGRCLHDRYAHEQCEDCVQDFARGILDQSPTEKEAG